MTKPDRSKPEWLPPGMDIKQLPTDPVIECERAPRFGGIRVFIRSGRHAARLTWDEVAPGGEYPAACALGDNQAQRLMDSLWLCGVRPSGREMVG